MVKVDAVIFDIDKCLADTKTWGVRCTLRYVRDVRDRETELIQLVKSSDDRNRE